MEDNDRNWSSYLPEPIIHKILQHLPPKDAIRASATSKPWCLAWISSPVLSFDESILPFKQSDFYDYAHRSLALWSERCDPSVDMEKLSLFADITTDESFSRLVELVSIATSHGVKVLELKSQLSYVVSDPDSLWPVLSACKSLDDLSLRSFKFRFLMSIPEMSSVRKLTVSWSFIDDLSLRDLLSSLPLLEDFVFELCFGFSELRISSPKLKRLEVTLMDDRAQKVVIDAVNLNYFLYNRTHRSFGSVRFLSSTKLLTTLRIESADFGTGIAIEEWLSQIPLLENLTLDSCIMRGGIRISHSNLKSLVLDHSFQLMKAEIDTPNLRFFKHGGALFHFSKFSYCSGLLDAQLRSGTCTFDCTEWFWFIKLRNFLENFGKCKTLSLRCYLEGCAEELRDNDMLPDPFYEMTHLNIDNFNLPIEHYTSFLNAIVQLFPCVETLILETRDAKISIEFDEYRYLNWEGTIYSSNSEEYDRICQFIDEATTKIEELYCRQEEDSQENECSAFTFPDFNCREDDINVFGACLPGAPEIEVQHNLYVSSQNI